jgi:hypothetical protein
MLQGIQGKHLAEKVGGVVFVFGVFVTHLLITLMRVGHSSSEQVPQCFKEAIYEATMKVVRSLILTKPK